MLAIWKREVQNYFLTPIGYVFMGIFLVIGGLFFHLSNVRALSSDLTTLFGNLSYLLMLLVPILTMRLLSEEKRNKSDQLLITSPRSISDIVVGKFLAACTVLLATMVVTLIYIVVIVSYSRQTYPGLIISNYLGFFLMGCCYIAIGTLVSAMTESQVSAAVLTLGINFVLMLLEGYASQIVLPGVLSFLNTAISWVSLQRRLYDFMAGSLNVANIFYYLSFCGIFLFLAVRVIDKRRWSEG